MAVWLNKQLRYLQPLASPYERREAKPYTTLCYPISPPFSLPSDQRQWGPIVWFRLPIPRPRVPPSVRPRPSSALLGRCQPLGGRQ